MKTSRRCVIIAGSPDADAATIKTAVRGGDFIMCADRGYATAKAAGLVPDVVIGDFDSYGGELPSDCEVIRLCPEKDDTDTMHCVTTALERRFRDFLLLGAIGGRLDHSLANLCVLEALAAQGATGCIVSDSEMIMLLREGRHRCGGYKGRTFSVFPFGCASVTLTYEGAYYPLRHGTLTHAVPMGVSNVFTDDEALITVHSGQALLILHLR